MLKEPKKREAEGVEEIAQFGGEDVKYTPRCHCHTPTAITMVANNNGVAWEGGLRRICRLAKHRHTHSHSHTGGVEATNTYAPQDPEEKSESDSRARRQATDPGVAHTHSCKLKNRAKFWRLKTKTKQQLGVFV